MRTRSRHVPDVHYTYTYYINVGSVLVFYTNFWSLITAPFDIFSSRAIPTVLEIDRPKVTPVPSGRFKTRFYFIGHENSISSTTPRSNGLNNR